MAITLWRFPWLLHLSGRQSVLPRHALIRRWTGAVNIEALDVVGRRPIYLDSGLTTRLNKRAVNVALQPTPADYDWPLSSHKLK